MYAVPGRVNEEDIRGCLVIQPGVGTRTENARPGYRPDMYHGISQLQPLWDVAVCGVATCMEHIDTYIGGALVVCIACALHAQL